MDDVLVIYDRMPSTEAVTMSSESGLVFIVPPPQHGRGSATKNIGQAKRLTSARLPWLKSLTSKDFVLVGLGHDVRETQSQSLFLRAWSRA